MNWIELAGAFACLGFGSFAMGVLVGIIVAGD